MEFNYLFENSLDLRVLIVDYKTNPELEHVITQSYHKFPPEHNFTSSYIEITRFRKVLRLILQLFQNAKSEIWTIIGPIYQVNKVDISVLKILAQEKFYDELNQGIKESTGKGVYI